MNIPLLDLKLQHASIKEEITAAINQVLEAGNYILGPNVRALEEEIAAYCGTIYGVGVANGTDAILLALEAFGIGPGDEVITTPFTFFATAEVISKLGATPVFVDIDPKTYNIDVGKIEDRITPKTKAIIPVHIFGQMADMDPIMEIANRYDLVVIEDACQAIGAEYKGIKAGSIGHAGCFSFFPSKNLGCYGDGGMVVTNDSKVMEKIKILRVHGSETKYFHTSLGYNSRLDELQAAILRVKLKYLDQWNGARAEKAKCYESLLANCDVVTPYAEENYKHVYHLYIIKVQNRNELMSRLKANGIASGIYYPLPLHFQEVYKNLGYNKGDLPQAEKAAEETLAVPLFPDLKEEDILEVTNVIKGI